MIRRTSIGFRLTAWYAAVLVVSLGLFGLLVWFSLRARMLDEIDRDLAGRAARFEQYFRAEAAETHNSDNLRDELNEFSQALPPGSSIDLRGAHGFRFRYAVGTPPGQPRIFKQTFDMNGEAYTLDVRASADDALHTLELLRWLLAGLMPVVVAVACLGGAWLSRRALKPVSGIAAAARAISIENLAGRLPVPDSGDEIAHLSEVLNTMLARLEAAVRMLSQFVADASHELRTPLSVIRAGAELALRRPRSSEEYRAAIAEIAAESERMTVLIEDLLTLARSDTSAAEMPLEAVDLGEIVESVCREMYSLAQLREVRIKTSTAGRAVLVAGNRAALHRLLVVILDNAIKFSNAGGEVIVTLGAEEARVLLSIEDFGCGISPEDLPHIFTRFYRADPSRSGEGHGLGLALALSIARIHAARIEARSGKSTIFEITFPSRSPSPTPASVSVFSES